MGFPVDKTRFINELTKTVEEKEQEIKKLKDNVSSVTIAPISVYIFIIKGILV